jgi:hypothetical protein
MLGLMRQIADCVLGTTFPQNPRGMRKIPVAEFNRRDLAGQSRN